MDLKKFCVAERLHCPNDEKIAEVLFSSERRAVHRNWIVAKAEMIIKELPAADIIYKKVEKLKDLETDLGFYSKKEEVLAWVILDYFENANGLIDAWRKEGRLSTVLKNMIGSGDDLVAQLDSWIELYTE